MLRVLLLWNGRLPAGSGNGTLPLMTLSQKINARLGRLPTWPIYMVGLLVPFWYLYLGLTGGLGVEPIEALEHRLGELALQGLILGLAVRPLRDLTRVNLIKFRRAIGLMTFYFVSCHLLVWLVLDVQILSQIWADILKRPYITIGMTGFILLVPLALTSNNWSIRKLGPLKWRRLHQLSYLAAILGAVHWVMLAKGFQIEPLVYLGIVILLLALRIPRPAKRAVV